MHTQRADNHGAHVFMRQHREVIARHWRSWEITRLPGFDWRGDPDKPLTAFCATKRMPSKFWRFTLQYDELDACVPLDGVFSHILDTCGPADVTIDVWNPPAAQQYDPGTGLWTSIASTPASLVDPASRV